MRIHRLPAALSLAVGALFVPTAFAAGEPAAGLLQLQREIELQRAKLEEQQRALDAAERSLFEHRRALREARKELDALQARVTGSGQATGTPAGRLAQAEPDAVGQAPEKPKEAQVPQVTHIFDEPGVLTPKGRWVVEPSLQYSYSSFNQVSLVGYTIIPALVIGLIDVRSVNSTAWTAAVTARYGVTNRLEVEAKIPYVYRNNETVTRPINLEPSSVDSVYRADGSGIGDVEFAARYQLNDGGPNGPYYAAGLRFKTRTGKDPFSVPYLQGTTAGTGTLPTSLPTGSGFYGIQPSLTAIYPSDPVVFFGGVNYLWNLSRDVDKQITPGESGYIGKVSPGNAFGFNFGMGLALNERASFSLGYEHSYIGKTKFDGATGVSATSAQLASLLMGYSYQLDKRTSLNLSVAAGLTNATPNTQITLRVPTTF